jgi:D,D-heptose 1,7-bisphosphate phosphatase
MSMNRTPDRVKALILAAGLGTRLRPLTDTVPKCLVPVGGRPLLDVWVERLEDAGIREARVNTHTHADLVRDHVLRVNLRGRLRLAESHEPRLLGSAGTVTAAADLARDADHVVIIYADNFSDVDLRGLVAFHQSHGDPFTMLLFRAADPRSCGIVEADDAGRIVSFVEKPREPKGNLANAGVYVVTADAYREIASMGAFDLGFEVLPRYVGRMRGWVWDGYHVDVGSARALERVRRDAAGLRVATRSGRRATRPAVFLDRDGTVIEQVHYLSDPGRVRVLPGVPEALRWLGEAGFARVVVTNQSALGRGMLSEPVLHRIHDEMNRQLGAQGASIDAIYYCPTLPVGDDRTVAEDRDRKPGPGMLIRASREMGLDLGSSWMVGDMISDVLAGINARCRGSILVGTGKGLSEAERALNIDHETADDLRRAAELILTRSE